MKGSSAGFLWLEYTVLLALIESRTLLVSNIWFLAGILETRVVERSSNLAGKQSLLLVVMNLIRNIFVSTSASIRYHVNTA